jgi:hypothetical protein
MFSVLHQYKLRLTNLSQANRSLKLHRLSARKDVDLADLSQLNQLSATEILGKIIAGQNVTLIKGLSARDEPTNLMDRRLNNVWHEITTLYEESGTYDLFLGYPFVEGRFLDGSMARCPVVLFPVRLHRDFQGGPRWVLQALPEEDLTFNDTFFLAYEKFMQVRLKREFWDDGPKRDDDMQGFLNGLYQQMTQHEIAVHFNSELFQFRVDHFPEKNQALLEQLPVGKLRFLPHAVVGIFPQSDSALLQDYEVLERQAGAFSLEKYFMPAAMPGLGKQAAPPKEDERYFVASVDQSQEEALLSVRAGESVVLHGPPGTGKSQVILNLISDALARGQRVLVCSQKRAALDVVFHRLSEVGLGRFAALVHDYRGDRNKIFARIRQQIEDIDRFEADRRDIGLDIWLRDFRLESRRLDELNTQFEQLFQALTHRGRCGLSAHELYLMADRKAPRIEMSGIAVHFDHESWREFREKLGSIMDYADLLDAGHPWRHRIPFSRLGWEGQGGIRERLGMLPKAVDDLHLQWMELGKAGKTVTQVGQIPELLVAFRALAAKVALPGAKADLAAAITDQLKPKFLRDHLQKLEKLFQKMAAFQILDGLPLQLHEDLKRNVEVYEAGQAKMGRLFSTKWLKAWWYVRQLLKNRGRKLREPDFKLLKAEVVTLCKVMELSMAVNEYGFFSDIPLAGTPAELMAWKAQKLRNVELVVAWQEFKAWEAFKPPIRNGEFDDRQWNGLVSDVNRLEAIRLTADRFAQLHLSWLHPRQIALLSEGMSAPEKAKAFAQGLLESFEGDFDDLFQLDTLLEGLAGNQRLAVEFLEGAMESLTKADLLSQAHQGMLQAWLSTIETAFLVLAEVSSRQMPDRLDTYRQLVEQRVKTVTGLIQCKLKDAILDRIEYNRLKNPVTYRDIAHQVRKQRQLWPVRKLVQQFWTEGLSELVPCWMASPESVAAIFPMVQEHFDLVIFDEASQCYVERALPVMLRGRQCVIAGDDKQLPPFDLYNVKVDEEEDPFIDDQAALEVESILDLARNKFKLCKLNWHYRSAEKALIDFSNHAFYEGRLNMVPPARHEAISIPPISYVKVQGIWERNSNLVEAQKVVALVEELIQRPENPSIGIVTFNYHQKELIRTLLEERLEQLRLIGDRKTMELLFRAMEREEGEERQGLFVKNIENVQGDERDVMIFSVGYARNAAGKLVAHFGLLNQKGGENRLNVAITRARKKKIIVTSIEPEELNVEDAKYDGPRLLKRYLQYARAASGGLDEMALDLLSKLKTVPQPTGPVPGLGLTTLNYVSKLKQMLEARGLSVEENKAEERFALDLMVVDAQGNYVLGIECEGRNYFLGRSAKEREVYRPALLKRRGWQLHRVWARNFFLDAHAEVERIVAKVNQGMGMPRQ